jgi:hypothetical protein
MRDTGFGVRHLPATCRYGNSQLLFRGPPRPLGGRHIAFLGGSETYGRFLMRPFPDLVEERLGIVCVNLGCLHASAGAFIDDPDILAACRRAAVTVIGITGAQNLSNRFYTVHPRRNDRFLRPSAALLRLYPEVDFTGFCFTRPMLMQLHATDPDRFAILCAELRTAWNARMRSLLARVGPGPVLLWLARHPPPPDAATPGDAPDWADPLLVTAPMVDALRPHVRRIVLVRPPSDTPPPPGSPAAAAHLPGQPAHDHAADLLVPVLRAAIGS